MAETTTGLEEGFQVLADDEDLRITHCPSEGPLHVVSFTGIGLGMAGIQTEEFRRTLGAGGGASMRAVTYVIDKRRSWFNRSRDRISETLARVVRPGQKVVTLGNSMGGFGAIYFASSIAGCIRAIAFAPQFSVNPSHMPRVETRWKAYRKAISPHLIEHAFDRPADHVDYIVIFGGAEDLDRRHARRMFAAAAGTKICMFQVLGGTHAVVGTIKQSGALQPLLEMLIGSETFDPMAVPRLLRAHGLQAGRFAPGASGGTAVAGVPPTGSR